MSSAEAICCTIPIMEKLNRENVVAQVFCFRQKACGQKYEFQLRRTSGILQSSVLVHEDHHRPEMFLVFQGWVWTISFVTATLHPLGNEGKPCKNFFTTFSVEFSIGHSRFLPEHTLHQIMFLKRIRKTRCLFYLPRSL